MNETQAPYVIIGAMEEEVGALVSLMEDPIESSTEGVRYFKGRLGSKDVIVAQSGVGKVNAAYTTTVLILAFKPKLILNIGSAGGTKEDQNVGDIVVATRLQYHDLDIGPDTKTDSRYIFDLETKGINTILDSLEMPYHTGLIVSGDQFVTKASSSFANIQANFEDAIAVEMEATAVAAVAKKMDTPILVLRSLSDVTHHDSNAVDFDTYLKLASANSALICEAYLKAQ